MLNPIPTRLCHVIYYHTDKKYPCLVGLGLIEENMDLSHIHLAVLSKEKSQKFECDFKRIQTHCDVVSGFVAFSSFYLSKVFTQFLLDCCVQFSSRVLLIDLKSTILFHQVNRLDSSDVNRIFLQKV